MIGNSVQATSPGSPARSLKIEPRRQDGSLLCTDRQIRTAAYSRIAKERRLRVSISTVSVLSRHVTDIPQQFGKTAKLEQTIKANLKGLGYGG